jgi:hypothetical protein
MMFKSSNQVRKKSDYPTVFSSEECDALFAAVLVHDELYPEATLPDAIHLDYTQEQLSQCYRICQQLWQEGPNRQALSQMVDKIYKQGKLNEQDQYEYYCMRAKIKHLRFAFIMFDKSHRYPRVFHWMTAVMGHLQDVLKNAAHSSVWPAALLVRLFLSKPLYAIAVKEIEGFQPSTVDGFRQYIKNEINFIRLDLAKDEITSHEFHDMRKVISRQVAMYDNFKTLYPSAYHQSISKFVSTLNGLMGSMHDELIVKKFNKTQDYYKDTFVMPEEIRLRLKEYTEKYDY